MHFENISLSHHDHPRGPVNDIIVDVEHQQHQPTIIKVIKPTKRPTLSRSYDSDSRCLQFSHFEPCMARGCQLALSPAQEQPEDLQPGLLCAWHAFVYSTSIKTLIDTSRAWTRIERPNDTCAYTRQVSASQPGPPLDREATIDQVATEMRSNPDFMELF